MLRSQRFKISLFYQKSYDFDTISFLIFCCVKFNFQFVQLIPIVMNFTPVKEVCVVSDSFITVLLYDFCTLI